MLTRAVKKAQVHFERREDVDSPAVDCGRGGGVGQTEDGKIRGFLVEKRCARIQNLGRAREVVAAPLR